MDWPAVSKILLAEGLISNPSALCEPLTGGVSSDIFLITDGLNRLVLKQALAQLKVADPWLADLSRNQVEQDFIHFAEEHLPGTVPRILYSNSELGFFIMEFLDSSFNNWKDQLLSGNFQTSTAMAAAETLSAIHSKSYDNPQVQSRFSTTKNFKALRIDPYLLTTGERNPDLKQLFQEEAKRLENHSEALVHGDFSPKNIMVSPDRVVLLDHEVACYGDPAFDLGFLLTHLYFKQLMHLDQIDSLPDLSQVFWRKYLERVQVKDIDGLIIRAGRLQLMIMLARLDGKSPVEYWSKSDPEAKLVRQFVNDLLPENRFDKEDLNQEWLIRLRN